MARPDLRRRVAKLEQAQLGPSRVVVIEFWTEEELDREVERRKAAGLIRPQDLVVGIRRFSQRPSAIVNG